MLGLKARFSSGRSSVGSRVRGWLHSGLVLAGWAYPISLLLAWLALVTWGDFWWLTTAILYLPRLGFLVPLPFIAGGLALTKRWRLCALQVVSLFVAVFPLMGFEFPRPRFNDDQDTVRVLSFNVNSCYVGLDKIASHVLSLEPDIALIQEAGSASEELANALKARLPHSDIAPYSMIVSRFPLVEKTPSSPIPYWGRERSARFQRYVVQGPWKEMAVYNVHPISPRGALNLYRFRGAFGKLRRGEVVTEETTDALEYNSGLRRLQVQAVHRLATQEKRPTIVGGDFNLPGLTPTLTRNLGMLRDGFARIGGGFGYTFPADYPWMRLDRVFTSTDLDFASFQIGCEELSDHLCVLAEVVRAD